MKPTLKTIPLLIAAVLLPTLAFSNTNRIVLRVNDRMATTYDYQVRRSASVKALREAPNLTEEQRQEYLSRVGEETMSTLFEELLLLSRADQLGLELPQSAIDQAIQEAKTSMGIETTEQFQAALQASGMTLEDLRDQYRRNMTMRQVMGRDVQARAALEEEDLRRYYQSHSAEFEVPERLHLEEIVVLDSTDLDTEGMARLAQEIRDKYLAGTALAELADTYAADGLTAGPFDLGWVEVGDLDRNLEEAVWQLQPGEMGEPVLARGGLHLLGVVERQEATLLPFAEAREQIEAKERDRRFAEEVEKYMVELEAKSYVVANPPPEAAGFRAAAPAPVIDPLGVLDEPLSESAEDQPEAEEDEPEPDAESESPPPR
jgi:parvulin-like peptidyl-prolyl isomerase